MVGTENSGYLTPAQFNEKQHSHGVGDVEGVWFLGTIEHPERRITWDYVAEAGDSAYYRFSLYADDEYEFAGWVRQFNHDYYTTVYRKSYEGTYYTTGTDADGRFYTDYAISAENEEPISQMYTGHYVFGCTLPNVVVEEKNTSLKMVVAIDGNEFTYYIRK